MSKCHQKKKRVNVREHRRVSSTGRPHSVKRHVRHINRRELPKHYAKALSAVARHRQEVGGSIDFKKYKSGPTDVFLHSGRAGSVDLQIDDDREVIFHTHPIQNKMGTLYPRMEEAIQKTPSPEDVFIAIDNNPNVTWLIATPNYLTEYYVRPTMSGDRRKLKRSLQREYNKLNRESRKVGKNIRDPIERELRQTRWFADEWAKTLRKKGLAVRITPITEPIKLHLGEIR